MISFGFFDLVDLTVRVPRTKLLNGDIFQHRGWQKKRVYLLFRRKKNVLFSHAQSARLNREMQETFTTENEDKETREECCSVEGEA